MLSFWEENSLLKADVVIIGSGIVGLSTAASILEKTPNKRVVILERGWLPTGASTKNAGFACFGSLTELLSDLKLNSPNEVLDLVRMRWNGLENLKNRLGEKAIGFKNYGGFEFLSSANESAIGSMELINRLLREVFDDTVFTVNNEKINEFGVNGDYVKYVLKNKYEGQIDTGKMIDALWKYCNQLGVRILNGSKVLEYYEHSNHVVLKVESNAGTFDFVADHLIVCTNAFSNRFFDTEMVPGRGQVLVTKPIQGLKLKGTFHLDEGYYYLRDFENRVIFGGGRNLDFKTEETIELGTTKKIQNELDRVLKEVFLPNTVFEIEKRWSGIMAFGPDKSVICQQESNRVFSGYRLGGMGVAIGSSIGSSLAKLYLSV